MRLQSILMVSVLCIMSFTHVTGNPGAGEYERVTVTYIANEGVLLSYQDQQVLIDAIHLPYYPQYLPTDEAMLAAMFAAEQPFDGVDLVLVSHVHRDHFHAETVAEYLQKISETHVFSTPQVADSLAEHTSEKAQERVHVAHYEHGKFSKYEVDGIKVELAKVAHGTPDRFGWIQNAAHVITMGGKTFLHVGDPGFDETDFEALNLAERNIDVAILPYWLPAYEGGRKVVEEWIKPTAIIATHISPQDTADVVEVMAEQFPDAAVFTRPGQKVTF